MIILCLFVIGIVTGTLSAMLGLGGGILLVPILTIVFHLPIRIAVGASLITIIATSTGVAIIEPKERAGDVRLALRLEVATTAGAVIGGVLAGFVSEKLIEVIFAIVALFTAVYMVYKSHHHEQINTPNNRSDQSVSETLSSKNYQPKHWLAGLGMAGIAGTVSGLLGVSGGFIKVPVMYSIMEVPLGIATTTSSIMVGITAAASVFIYYLRGDIYPLVAIPVALGVFTGALAGNLLQPHAKVVWLRSGLVGILVILGGQMILKAAGV